MMCTRQPDQVDRSFSLHTEATEFRRLFRFDLLPLLRKLAGFVFQFLALRFVLGNLRTKIPPLEKIPEPLQLVTVFLEFLNNLTELFLLGLQRTLFDLEFPGPHPLCLAKIGHMQLPFPGLPHLGHFENQFFYAPAAILPYPPELEKNQCIERGGWLGK